MHNHLWSCAEWAQAQFSSVELGDCRRVRRLVKVAAALAAHPSGTLPGALPEWGDLKAGYRLLSNSNLTFQKALSPHWTKTLQACSQPGQCLLVEDSTLLDFSSRTHLKGIGRIGDDRGRGINLHTTLAFSFQDAGDEQQPVLSLLGLAGQELWVRGEEFTRGEGVAMGREKKKRKFSRARESERWGRTLAGLPPRQKECERIFIADRESDIYELFERCHQAECDYVVRACQNRALNQSEGSLFQKVGEQPALGHYNLTLRARPGAPARMATIAVRACNAVLRPPYRPGPAKLPPRELMVVEAREVNPSSSAESVHWILLTSLECATFEQARRVVKLYACRWIIEEYYKALKTGAGIEQTQLQERARLEGLLAILSLVAARLLALKLEAARCPEAPLLSRDIEPAALKILEATFGPPKQGWTQRSLWIWIARLGGYLARKSDGPPGWQTLWRGWNKLQQMLAGIHLLRGRCG